MAKFFDNPFRQEPLPENTDENTITDALLKKYKSDSGERQRDIYWKEMCQLLCHLNTEKTEYPERTMYKKRLLEMAQKRRIGSAEVKECISILHKMRACLERQKILEFQPDPALQNKIRNLNIEILSLQSARDVSHMMRSLLYMLKHRDTAAVEELLHGMETKIQRCQSRKEQKEVDQAAGGGLSVAEIREGGLSLAKEERGTLEIAEDGLEKKDKE